MKDVKHESKFWKPGRYRVTIEGNHFQVWREPFSPQRWFVNLDPDTIMETLKTDGFRTKREAMEWLLENWKKYQQK